MAQGSAQESTGNVPAEEWEEVTGESQIVMEKISDSFTGLYHGMDQTPDGKMWQGHWTLPDQSPAFMNLTRDLKRKLDQVKPETFTRITWVDEMDTGHPTNKMRIFRVETRK